VTLAVVPSYARTEEDLDTLRTCLRTMRRTEDCDVVVVDDGGPMEGALDVADEFDAAGIRTENGGFSRAVNVGLQMALDSGRDAVLVNSDIELYHKGWLEAMEGNPAEVVGALLLYPHGVVQHAGIYFCPLQRAWAERFKYAPQDLPAVHLPRTCPVTGALQLIRHKALERIGLYPTEYRLGWEDVSYCIRTFDAGMTCAYEPTAVAYHHESLTRGRPTKKIVDWTNASWNTLQKEFKGRNFTGWHHG
jgi:GT2 family glycosyltransferase